MKNLKVKNKSIRLSVLIAFLIMAAFTGSVSAANYPLEVLNIKPSGTGDPAIPSNNRIFFAYPGIEYNIRAAVAFGAYPYTYELSGAPDGMTINENTGEIIWPNPQADAANIQLVVTDNEGTTVNATWNIEVTSNGFIFVDSNAATNGNGTLSSPYDSMLSFLTATEGNTSGIVYFRGGNYSIEDWNSDASNRNLNLNNNPSTWIGYPGETVNIEGYANGESKTEQLSIYILNPFYFDNINFSGFGNHGIYTWSATDYMTVRRCHFTDIEATSSANQNQGFIYVSHSGTCYFLIIQDNEFSNFSGTSAIGSLYYTSKALIDSNYIHSFDGGGITGIRNGLCPKYYTDYLTIRGNKVEMTNGAPLGNSINSMLYSSNHIEVCFNIFAGGDIVHLFNTNGYHEEGATSNLHYYRNTVVGDTVQFRFNPCENYGGPFSLYDNVMIVNTIRMGAGNSAEDYTINAADMDVNCGQVSYSGNLSGTGVIDENYNLTGSYSKYIGTKGYQINTSTLTSPQNLTIMPQ